MDKLNLHHRYDVLLPSEGYWIVHDEISGLSKLGEINLINMAKSLAQDAEIILIGGISTGTTACVAAISRSIWQIQRRD